MKNFFLLSAFLFLNQFLYSQDTLKTNLSEIVISATKSESPYYSIGSSITVISAEKILQSGKNSVAELLREVPGVSIVQQGGLGKLTRVFIRGANSDHTLVVIDGVEMNDASSPNNAFDFASLNTFDIERIEIVRGAQSTLYGSDAIAGVINIITKKGGLKPQYTFIAEGGSNAFYRGSFNTSGSYSIADYSFSSTKLNSGGISSSSSRNGNVEKDKFSDEGVSANLSLKLIPNLNLNFQYRYASSETGLDQSEKFGDDPNFNYNTEDQLFKILAETSFLENRISTKLIHSLTKRFSRSLDETDSARPFTFSDSYNRAQRQKTELQNEIRLIENNVITIGLENETEKAHTSYYSTSEWGPYESVFPDASITTNGIYIQDQLNVKNSFFASVGIRYDKNSKFGGISTFRIAPVYFISSTGTKIKMTYGTGFKAPSLFYLLDPMFGNPDLKPEKSGSLDFGVEQYFYNGKYSISITAYDMKFTNMFGYDSAFRTINIAEATTKGFEFSGSMNNVYGFTFDAAYTYNKTKDEYKMSSDYDKPLLRRPEHQLIFNAAYNLNDILNISANIRYTGKRDDKDFSNYQPVRVTMPDYTLVNINASYKFFDKLTLTARIENLLDKEYEEVLFYGTMRRSFYAGLAYTL